jgi:aspartyl-tRNA(Asn)/glutamyl-tRNA(Gln) amidotransferase subunit A
VPADPLQQGSLADFARRLRNGETSAEQATLAYLERIAAIDPRIGAFRAVDRAAALDQARRVDRQRVAGDDRGPLMGVPVAIKELFGVAGLPFGAGSEIDLSDVTPAEGPFVAGLRRAGCVVLGTTSTTEFAAATINSRKPGPWNPWDAAVRRVCGGSSHGSAAALAARLCAFSVGSDTGGSVRLPAALCGLVGFKPTMGVWSTQGVFPLSPTFDTVGVFTHGVADAAAIFHATTGQRPAASAPVNELRLGRAVPLFEDLDRPVEIAMARAMRQLEDAGVRLVDIDLPETAELAGVFGRILAGELVLYLGRGRLLAQRARIDPVPWSRIEPELDIDPATLDTLRARQRAIAAAVAQRMRDVDALVSPTTPLLADPAADLGDAAAAIAWNRRSGRNTRPGNLFGLCGISLPIHHAGELPVGLQLLGPAASDARLLALAASVAAILGRGPDPDLAPFCVTSSKEGRHE